MICLSVMLASIRTGLTNIRNTFQIGNLTRRCSTRCSMMSHPGLCSTICFAIHLVIAAATTVLVARYGRISISSNSPKLVPRVCSRLRDTHFSMTISLFGSTGLFALTVGKHSNLTTKILPEFSPYLLTFKNIIAL